MIVTIILAAVAAGALFVVGCVAMLAMNDVQLD